MWPVVRCLKLHMLFSGVLFVCYVIAAKRVSPISVIPSWPEAQGHKYIFKPEKREIVKRHKYYEWSFKWGRSVL